MAAPKAVPIAPAVGAAHPCALKVALPLSDAGELVPGEPDTVGLDPVVTGCWLGAEAVVGDVGEVLALFDALPLHEVSATTTSPPKATAAILARLLDA